MAIVNPDRLAKEILAKNLSGSYTDIENMIKNCWILVYHYTFSSEISGIFTWAGNQPVIGINKVHPKVRHRFTIAHELYHFLKHLKDSYSVKPSFDYLEPPLDGAQVKLYAFHDANSKRLVMRVNYTGKGWIFFDYCIFLVRDHRYSTPIYLSTSDSVYRNVISSADLVSESIYMDAKNTDIMSIINAIETNNDNVAVEYKLYGSRGTISGKLSSRELQSWHDVFSYYASIELP